MAEIIQLVEQSHLQASVYRLLKAHDLVTSKRVGVLSLFHTTWEFSSVPKISSRADLSLSGRIAATIRTNGS
jgi:hypothetical protein